MHEGMHACAHTQKRDKRTENLTVDCLGISQCYQSVVVILFPGDLPNPVIELRSPALQADSLPC